MKREDVTKAIPDATKEQVDAILNAAGADLTKVNENLRATTEKLDAATAQIKNLEAAAAASAGEMEALRKQAEANMTAEQLLQQREEAAAKREREFMRKSNELDARGIFQKAGIVDCEDLLKGVVSEDADATKALASQIASTVKAQRDAAVQAKQDELLKSNPGLAGTGKPTSVTKDAFVKMTFAEQAKVLEENPGLLETFK